MTGDSGKLVERLNDLIALDIDAVNAYDAAISRMTVPSVRARLEMYQADHRRHVQDLSECVARFGGTARSKGDLKGFLLKGFTAVTAMMGDEAALRAMQGNEKLTNRTYKQALAEDWPNDVREIIERNYDDEQGHLASIEAMLRDRPWEEEAAEPLSP